MMQQVLVWDMESCAANQAGTVGQYMSMPQVAAHGNPYCLHCKKIVSKVETVCAPMHKTSSITLLCPVDWLRKEE